MLEAEGCMMLCFLLIFFPRQHFFTEKHMVVWWSGLMIDFWWVFFQTLIKTSPLWYPFKKIPQGPMSSGTPPASTICIILLMHEAQVSSTTPKPSMLQPDGSSGWQSTDAYPSRNKQNDHLNHHLAVDFFSSHRIQSLEFEGHIEWQELHVKIKVSTLKVASTELDPGIGSFQLWRFRSLCKCRNRGMAWLELSLLESHSDSHFKKYSQYCNTDDGRESG